MNPKLEFEVPTWNQVYSMLLDLAERIQKANFKPDIIVGISRGGWAPARVLSDLLDNPNLANVRAEFYLGVAETKGQPTLTQPISVSVANTKVLIVDEVADTGQSLKIVKNHILEHGANEVKIVTVYYKPWSIVKPDYYAKETDSWIVFPWEVKETIKKLLKKCRDKGSLIEIEKLKLTKAGIPSGLIERFQKEILEAEKC
jgi:hypothetical protein